MSNYLAIATATAALKQKILAAIDRDLPGAVSGTDVTTLPPAALEGDRSTPGVNIFLYQTFENPRARSADLPIRDPSGGPDQRPIRALDLSYLLTFTGDDSQHEPQRLLGMVASALLASPILEPERITSTIGLPENASLTSSDLAAQVELVRLSPLNLTLEELSRLWSVMVRTEYRLSAAYLATTVLLDGRDT